MCVWVNQILGEGLDCVEMYNKVLEWKRNGRPVAAPIISYTRNVWATVNVAPVVTAIDATAVDSSVAGPSGLNETERSLTEVISTNQKRSGPSGSSSQVTPASKKPKVRGYLTQK